MKKIKTIPEPSPVAERHKIVQEMFAKLNEVIVAVNKIIEEDKKDAS